MRLPTPKGRQPYVIFLPGQGHQVVLGTAGTGKTTMAMLRAEHLAAPTTANSGRVLLVTYNNALVTYLRYLQPAAAQNITIETYGRFARGYLNSIGQMPSWNGIAQPADRRMWVEQAVKEVAKTYQPGSFFSRDTGFFLDELEWISGMGVASLDEYKEVPRVGRERGLANAQKEAVWKILMVYRRLRTDAGRRYDWYDLASSVHAAFAQDKRPRHYRHVVIDEGQDLSPEAIRSLVAAVDPQGSVTFFGDYHQMIYGQGMSWRSCGLKIQRVERFADNYRNTAEIARLAIAMSRMPHMAGDPQDLVEPREPAAAGTRPTLVECRDEAQEMDIIRAQATDFARNGTVAVLARTWADARQVCEGLRVRNLQPDLNRWDATPGIYCGAYHSAKGLEFDAVLMPFCGVAHMPHPDTVTAFGDDEAAAREGRLLYVSTTRARTDLLLTYSGTVTPLLPSDDALYAKVTP
ncbi:UvrD-helicase domain-containing protein [Planotetraspora kaengkrachanensis]|uniref:DNA 3'-5' helicase n=1 Tax=Planotetraspora kaengkrachanensis TaxID=575193 RepID=A0A8J3PS79_9ACTN|nr:UvrD-helicase domain-containing protein [Planotetraspora kaengkrachanensis]GIG79952.1 DNA helicase [Planotetraspora kaengkrachanensis]